MSTKELKYQKYVEYEIESLVEFNLLLQAVAGIIKSKDKLEDIQWPLTIKLNMPATEGDKEKYNVTSSH